MGDSRTEEYEFILLPHVFERGEILGWGGGEKYACFKAEIKIWIIR
jgi:hypothetical protein